MRSALVALYQIHGWHRREGIHSSPDYDSSHGRGVRPFQLLRTVTAFGTGGRKFKFFPCDRMFKMRSVPGRGPPGRFRQFQKRHVLDD